jgi:hypothetical protein
MDTLTTSFDIVFDFINRLVEFGLYIQDNPVLVIGFMIALVIAIILLRFFIKSIFVIIPIIIVCAILIFAGLYLYNYLNTNKSNVLLTENNLRDWFGDELATLLIERDQYYHGHYHEDDQNLLLPVQYSNLQRATRAPSLRRLSYNDGIARLKSISEQFTGEVAYFYLIESNGREGWTPGAITQGRVVTIAIPDQVFRRGAVREIRHVHTHPVGIGGTISGNHLPPSLLDIVGLIQLTNALASSTPSATAIGVVVAGQHIWEYSTRNVDINRLTNERVVLEIINQLEPVYACMITENSCNNVTERQKDRAVSRLLEIYRQAGVEITLRQFNTDV